MKAKFNEDQRKSCHFATRCMMSATAAILHDDTQFGQPLMDRAEALLMKMGADGEALSEADLDAAERDTLGRALEVAHFVLTLSKTFPMNEEDRNLILKGIRHCAAAIKQ